MKPKIVSSGIISCFSDNRNISGGSNINRKSVRTHHIKIINISENRGSSNISDRSLYKRQYKPHISSATLYLNSNSINITYTSGSKKISEIRNKIICLNDKKHSEHNVIKTKAKEENQPVYWKIGSSGTRLNHWYHQNQWQIQ